MPSVSVHKFMPGGHGCYLWVTLRSSDLTAVFSGFLPNGALPVKENAHVNQSAPIYLSPGDFIAKGSHKKCFQHPQDPARCIKIPYNAPGETDLHREVHYLTRVLKQRAAQSGILPKYHGKVQTNLGEGHVFDLIRDFDGEISRSLAHALASESLLQTRFYGLKNALVALRESMFKYQIISMAIYPENILLQRLNPYDFKLMYINDMGSGAFLPLEYYIPAAAHAKVKRRWNRFIRSLLRQYEHPAAAELMRDISFM